MDVWQITLAALRRWYVLLPLLALTGFGVYAVGKGVEPEYEVTASALLTPGSEPPSVPNPYGGLDQASAAVGIVLNSSHVRDSLVADGLLGDYAVTTQSRSTIMRFEVRGPTPEIAMATADAVFEAAREELAARQGGAGVPPASQYGLDVLAVPTVLDTVYEGKARAQVVVGALGAGAALLVAVLFDDIIVLLKRRARARHGHRTADHTPSEREPGPPQPDSDRRRDRASV